MEPPFDHPMDRNPALQFSIPSIHDGTILDCRIYHPASLTSSICSWRRHAAILAHPYAPMGGCLDDPVLLAVGTQLLRRGYLLGLFNFRGAGASAGRTSWTARPEGDDYASFVGFMVYYVHYLERALSGSTDRSRHRDEREGGEHGSLRKPPLLLMGGFSYGAMVTAHMPSLGDLVEVFRSPAPGSHAEQIRLRAKAMAEQHRCHSSDLDPSRPPPPSDDAKELLIPKPAYLLISPPAPGGLVATLTTLSLPLTNSLRRVESEEPAEGAEAKLVRNRTLIVYGGGDALVSVGRLRAWAGRLRGGSSLFEAEEVASAGHFWSEEGVLSRLVRAVGGFARRLQDEG